MNVLDPGHEYELNSLDGGDPILLTFVKREGRGYPGNVGQHPGTTIQEVCRALIDRLRYVYCQIPCNEDLRSIEHLRRVIAELESRAADRHGRSGLKLWGHPAIELCPTCPTCGHIGCGDTCR